MIRPAALDFRKLRRVSLAVFIDGGLGRCLVWLRPGSLAPGSGLVLGLGRHRKFYPRRKPTRATIIARDNSKLQRTKGAASAFPVAIVEMMGLSKSARGGFTK